MQYKIELRDLESLLRKNGGALRILDYKTEPLLKLGENYGSTILKVHAVVKRKNEAEIEDLHLVAKMLPPTDFQRQIFDSSYTFRKEAFLYEELIPSYQRLEREFGVKEEEVFDIVPKLYGVRFSLEEDGDVDEDACILMENLKVQGYYMAERRKGLDSKHARAALAALSRFHALGIAMKHHNPEHFRLIKLRAKCLDLKLDKFEAVIEYYKQLMRGDPIMSCHYERIDAAMSQNTAEMWTAEPPEPWTTVVHADFWTNNFMFLADPEGERIAGVKFVDFQNYLIKSPLRELAFFLATNMQAEVMENEFDELLNYYYEHFIRVLRRMKCDVECFRRDKFDERLRIDAFDEFLHCPFMIKIMTAEVDDEYEVGNLTSLFIEENVDPVFLDRLRRCVKKYVEKGWL